MALFKWEICNFRTVLKHEFLHTEEWFPESMQNIGRKERKKGMREGKMQVEHEKPVLETL